MVKVIFHTIYKELLLKGKNLLPLGANSFTFKEVPILKMGAIQKNHCLIQLSPFDERNSFPIQATPMQMTLAERAKNLW